MKTCFFVAVLSTALIGGLAATSTRADAYAGWSCKSRVYELAQGQDSYEVLRKRARAQWAAYVQGHYGAAYLNPRGVQSGCSWFCYYSCTSLCSYAADPCKNHPPGKQTATPKAVGALQFVTPSGKVPSRPARAIGAPVGQGRLPVLRPRAQQL